MYETLERAKLIYNNKRQVSSCLEPGWGVTSKGDKEIWVMEMFYIIIVVVVMRAHIYQNSLNCTLKMGIFHFMYIYLNKVGFKTTAENNINNNQGYLKKDK